jgi:hypothetical protein
MPARSPAPAVGSGGSVSNTGTGLISAVADGVVIAGTTGNVDNTGTIQGGNLGVWLEAGGTVANSGSIAGTGTSSYGVRLTAGGSVTNGSPGVLDASITGAEGVGIVGAAGTVTNYGTIAATSHGVYFGAGGAITNRNLISGGTDVVFVTDSAGTITNSGTILGTTGAAIWLNAAAPSPTAAAARSAARATSFSSTTGWRPLSTTGRSTIPARAAAASVWMPAAASSTPGPFKIPWVSG